MALSGHLGFFNHIDEAVSARKTAESLLFQPA